MLPGRIIGSVEVGGRSRPFMLDVPTGQVVLDRFEEVDTMQGSVGSMEREAIEKRVRSETGGSRVRIGEYHCPQCNRWIDVARAPDQWAGDRCRACG